MSDLTLLTLADARDGLRSKRFSATELTQAHLTAIEHARPLNAYVLETPQEARAMAGEADARLQGGTARPLEGLPHLAMDADRPGQKTGRQGGSDRHLQDFLDRLFKAGKCFVELNGKIIQFVVRSADGQPLMQT